MNVSMCIFVVEVSNMVGCVGKCCRTVLGATAVTGRWRSQALRLSVPREHRGATAVKGLNNEIRDLYKGIDQKNVQIFCHKY